MKSITLDNLTIFMYGAAASAIIISYVIVPLASTKS